jgi:hypothetical protein
MDSQSSEIGVTGSCHIAAVTWQLSGLDGELRKHGIVSCGSEAVQCLDTFENDSTRCLLADAQSGTHRSDLVQSSWC